MIRSLWAAVCATTWARMEMRSVAVYFDCFPALSRRCCSLFHQWPEIFGFVTVEIAARLGTAFAV